MRFTQDQLDILSKYFADLSKILVASAVIGFFVPSGAIITLPVFIGGTVAAIGCLVFSIQLIKPPQAV